MTKKIFLSLLCLTIVPFAANAQESQTFVPPGSVWVNKAEETIKALNAQSLKEDGGKVPKELHLSIVKYDYMEPDQFGLLMKTPDTITGCYEVSPISYEATYVADLFMDVNVKSYTVKPVRTQKTEYACNQGYQAASALMILNIDDLKSRGTTQIRFTNGQARDNYNIIYGDGDISLKAESMIVFKSQGGSLRYLMGGGNVIALQVPMAKDGDIVEQEIRTLAAKNALTPVYDITKFDLKEKENVFYYIDENGRFSDSINNSGFATVGEIPVARPHMGENGIENIAVPLKVFVTKHNHTL